MNPIVSRLDRGRDTQGGNRHTVHNYFCRIEVIIISRFYTQFESIGRIIRTIATIAGIYFGASAVKRGQGFQSYCANWERAFSATGCTAIHNCDKLYHSLSSCRGLGHYLVLSVRCISGQLEFELVRKNKISAAGFNLQGNTAYFRLLEVVYIRRSVASIKLNFSR